MEISKQAELLLTALETASEGRIKVGIEVIRVVFLKTFPQWQGNTDRRERLRALLDQLDAAERVRLPRDRRRGWEQSPAPALPRSVMMVRETEALKDQFKHRSFPWVAELAFVAGFRTVANPDELRRIHDFLKDHPQRRPVVPVKERAFHLFGDEKRLDNLRKTILFDPGRLTLEMLRCRDVPASLPCVPAPRPSSGPWLIVENEAAFDSFARLNRALALHSGVILGSGRNVLRAVEFLSTIAKTSTHRDFLYFGDIDHDGIEIPALLDQRLHRQTEQHVVPATEYYEWLLMFFNVESKSRISGKLSRAVDWFPERMQNRIEDALGSAHPLVQEAIGWEYISTKLRISDHDVLA